MKPTTLVVQRRTNSAMYSFGVTMPAYRVVIPKTNERSTPASVIAAS